MVLKDSVYNKLKWICMFFLLFFAVFSRTITQIWGLPFGDEISSTIVAINVLLSAMLGISNMAYYNQKEES